MTVIVNKLSCSRNWYSGRSSKLMKSTAIVLMMLAGLMAGNLRADAIIQYQVTDLGGTLHRYNYALSGFNLLANAARVNNFETLRNEV